jgi:hypothetical protein
VEDNQKETRARHIPIAVNRARDAANFAIQSFRNRPPSSFSSCVPCRVHVFDPFSKKKVAGNYQKCTGGGTWNNRNKIDDSQAAK